MSNSGTIAAYGRSVLLTVQTNAAWPQRISIKGPTVNKTVEGSGERHIIWQAWVSAGAWHVEHWYKPPGGDWQPGSARRYGVGQIGFDDGAGDGDYNDTLVTATAVTKGIMEQALEFSESISPDVTDEQFILELP